MTPDAGFWQSITSNVFMLIGIGCIARVVLWEDRHQYSEIAKIILYLIGGVLFLTGLDWRINLHTGG